MLDYVTDTLSISYLLLSVLDFIAFMKDLTKKFVKDFINEHFKIIILQIVTLIYLKVFVILTCIEDFEFLLNQKTHSFNLHDHYDHLLQMIVS